MKLKELKKELIIKKMKKYKKILNKNQETTKIRI